MNLRKKPVKQEEKITHAVFIIDESGSMSTCRKETISGVNEQIQELKKFSDKIKTTVSFITFSGTVNKRFINVPIGDMPELTNNNYEPSGSTAMLDAVALGIQSAENFKFDTNNVTYLVYIVTDGDENASQEYSRYNNGYQQIANIIKRVTNTGKWTITYMGANQDLSEVNKNLGIDMSNIASYNSSVIGSKNAFTTLSSKTNDYLTKRSTVSEDDLKFLRSKFYNDSEVITNV